MAASNKQPIQGRPGPKAPNTHSVYQSGNPGSSSQSPAPRGPGDKKGINPKPTGKNKNRLH